MAEAEAGKDLVAESLTIYSVNVNRFAIFSKTNANYPFTFIFDKIGEK